MTTIAQHRARFVAEEAPRLASQVRPSARPWRGSIGLSRRFGWFADGDSLVVVATPYEQQSSVDLGLAFGLGHAGDRELVLVLPAGAEGPTQRRLPWLTAPVRLFTHHTATIAPVPALARFEVLAACDDSIVTTVHQLANRTPWVDRLVQWADLTPELVPAHRTSYLAWHCRGRLALRIKRTRSGLAVSAGVHSNQPEAGLTTLTLTGPLTAEQFHRLTAATSTTIADRLSGLDSGHAEHQLQERLAALRSRLGLRATVREFPAMRPGGTRGYIDLLGIDDDGGLHIVETKIGPDPMLVLQGLDYHVWLTAHLHQVAAHLSAELDIPVKPSRGVALDFVIGAGTGGYISPYTAAQAEALDGSIPWRVHTIEGWDSEQTTVASLPRRTMPPARRATSRRWAERLHDELLGRSTGNLTGPVFAVPGGGIYPAAHPVYEQLRAADSLHRFVDHIRSSQAFAINLFGGLDDAQQALLWWALTGADVTPTGLELEWIDPLDALAESQPNRPHQTQIDVMLRAIDPTGARLAALVEVKLSETAFGTCSAFESSANDRRDVCRTRGPWGHDTGACFQLRNHGGPHRRLYHEAIEPRWIGNLGAPGCPFRELNQPMRNVALARSLVERGEADRAIVALCAPLGNTNVWRQWRLSQALFERVPRVDLVDLPVGRVAESLDDERRSWLMERYGEEALT